MDAPYVSRDSEAPLEFLSDGFVVFHDQPHTLLLVILGRLMWSPMKQSYEYSVQSGDLEAQIERMAKGGWRFVWAGHYDLVPYIVFERELTSEH